MVLLDLEFFFVMYMKDGFYMKVNGSIFCINIFGFIYILSIILSKVLYVSNILYFFIY